jgi:hypothetical protein
LSAQSTVEPLPLIGIPLAPIGAERPKPVIGMHSYAPGGSRPTKIQFLAIAGSDVAFQRRFSPALNTFFVSLIL